MAIVRKYIGLWIVIFLSLVPLFDLLHPGLPITHDGQDHVVRIASFFQNLQQGTIIPRWAENLNWGYGHPLLIFFYPLSSYFASFFHIVGLSFVDSTKLVFALSFILSGITMYLWMKSFLGEYVGIAAGILYMYAPYRFVDLYVRGAIGEHVAFIFPPLICYFLLQLIKKKTSFHMIGVAFSLTGLLLAHNAVSIMFLPFIFLYIFFIFWTGEKDKNFLICAFFSIFLAFGLSSFFIIPAFFEGKYTLRDIVTSKGEYKASFVNLPDLLYGSWSYGGTLLLSKQIGITQLIGVVISLVYLKKMVFTKSQQIFFMSLFAFFLLTIFFMIKQSMFLWELATILQKFQFPWRFLNVIVFCTAILAAYPLVGIRKTINKKVFLFFIIVGALVCNSSYWHANGYLYKPESFFTNIYHGTTNDTGESAPRWTVRFMEKGPKGYAEIIDGRAKIINKARKIIIHTYIVTVTSDRARFRENTLYFPGWEVWIDGEQTEVEYQDVGNRGLITFYVPKGKHNVSILFADTKLRGVADAISVMFIIIISFMVIFNKTLRYKKISKQS